MIDVDAEMRRLAALSPMTAGIGVSDHVTQAMRRGILMAAQSQTLKRLADRHGMRLGADRFVAGITLDTCITALRRLDARGHITSVTILGEDTADIGSAVHVFNQYTKLLQRIDAEKLRSSIAVKPSHLGLHIDVSLAHRLLSDLLKLAEDLGLLVRIDMEGSATVQRTLDMYAHLRAEGHATAELALQAYLYRTEADLSRLLPLRPNVRIVKGAYHESRAVAFPRKADVNANFLKLVRMALIGKCYTAIATHDEHMIRKTIKIAQELRVSRDQFEFQMLYGVRPHLQQAVLESGYTVLVATPFGPDWFPFFSRRLAERPANLLFVLRSLITG